METEAGRPNKFWMVFVQDSPGCRYCHWYKQSAVDEAERLARMNSNSGKAVYVLEAISYCKTETKPIIWCEL